MVYPQKNSVLHKLEGDSTQKNACITIQNTLIQISKKIVSLISAIIQRRKTKQEHQVVQVPSVSHHQVQH